MQAYFNEHPITYRELLNGDQCSEAYAIGMTGCDNAFVIQASFIIGAYFANIIFYLGANALQSSFALTLGIAEAWAQLNSCQNTVVASWRICRANNPTH